MKKMCKSTGFEGHYSNHSLRSISATRMYESGIEEQVIADITGHHSLCVCSYKRTNTSQKRKASQALSQELCGRLDSKSARFEH